MNEDVNLSEHPSEESLQIDWNELYPRLHAFARSLVYTYRLPCWYGQEEDLANDVTQESVKRLIDQLQKAQRGEAEPVRAPGQLLMRIARNFVIDLVRHERRVIRDLEGEQENENRTGNNVVQIEEFATKNVYDEWLFLRLAQEIVHFPRKQYRAILIDLANRSCFEEQPTPLQAAFLAAGIDLQEYRLQLPESERERARHYALVSLAYKRIACLSHIKLQLDFIA